MGSMWLTFNKEKARSMFKTAIKEDDIDCVKALLECGFKPQESFNQAWGRKDYLRSAIKADNYRMIGLLLSLGCVPGLEHVELAIPYPTDSQCSVETQDLVLTGFLDESDNSCDKESVLEIVIKGGTFSQVRQVLLAGADPNCKTIGPQKISVWFHAFKMRKELVPLLNVHNARPIAADLRCGIRERNVGQVKDMLHCHPFMVEGLLQHVHKKQKAYLHVLKLFLHAPIFKCCVDSYCLHEQEMYTAHELFVNELSYTSAEMIKYFYTLGVDVNTKDSEGKTPLHKATNYDVMFALLESAALVEERDLQGQTIAHAFAARAIVDDKEANLAKSLLTTFLVTPLLFIKNVNTDKTQKALFAALCSMRRCCPTLPLDIKIKIAATAFDAIALNACWIKHAQRLPLHEKVSFSTWSVLTKCLEKEDHSTGGNHKERYLEELVKQHMCWLRTFLNIKDKHGKTAADFAKKEFSQLLDAQQNRDFMYNWRGLIDREYRYILYTD